MTGLVSRSLNNWLPFTASLESLEIAPSANFVILVSPASIPAPLIVTLFTVPPADVLVKVAPPLAKVSSVLPVVVLSPLFNVKPFVVSPDRDVMFVTLGFKSTLYLLVSVPSPVTVVLIPLSNFEGDVVVPPVAFAEIV